MRQCTSIVAGSEEKECEMLEQFKDLKIRFFLYSLVLLIFATLAFFSLNFGVQIVLAFAVYAMCALSLHEYTRIVLSKGVQLSLNQTLAIAAFLLSGLFLIAQGILPPWSLLAGLLMIMLITFLVEFRRIDGALVRISTQLLGHLYITLPLSSVLILLLAPPKIFTGDGRLWFAYTIAVAKASDVGGYFCGHLMGRRPLAPHLSPKKTVEGAIGGFIFSVLISLLFFWAEQSGLIMGIGLSWAESYYLAASASVLSQLGDLAESLIKRDAKLKDSSVLPAVGGVLDMIDSLLFVVPSMLFYVIATRGGQ
jgi:phosphatidate cytidylyltransferase